MTSINESVSLPIVQIQRSRDKALSVGNPDARIFQVDAFKQ